MELLKASYGYYDWVHNSRTGYSRQLDFFDGNLGSAATSDRDFILEN
jgi:hypothetical protein